MSDPLIVPAFEQAAKSDLELLADTVVRLARVVDGLALLVGDLQKRVKALEPPGQVKK